MRFLFVLVFMLVPFNVYAECTPAPDCASIGYTETSCEGDFVKCPFDTSKLFCIPCDSSFKYDCTGDNIIGGTGSTCGGKYANCECDNGLPFNNGVCPQSCTVGMIYYSDKSCSDELDNSKTVIGIVVKDNELVMSNITGSIQWGGFGTNISTLTNYGSETNAKTDFNGKDNTAKLVAHFGEDVDTTLHAGVFCHKYTTEGTNAGDWYLPAAGELYSYVYGNYNSKLKATATKLGWDIDYYFWSSSEESSLTAWYVLSYYDYVYGDSKDHTNSVSCFLDINELN